MYIEITSYNIVMSPPIIFKEIQFFSIPNHDKYYISRCGKILSCRNASGRYKEGKEYRKILSSCFNKSNGYKQYCIRKNNNKRETIPVHRLLAMTFIPNFSPKLDVDHKDGNRLNNNLSNLHMVTRSGNNKNQLYSIGVYLTKDKKRGTFYYTCSWNDENSIHKCKAFACNKYGYLFSYILALDLRAEMVELYYNRECKIWTDYLYLDNCECI